ncbi:hypothetical protein BRD02_01115 [Halobacteriales archaeon QS_8_69_73]|nr:MAG: hypothetical protein BRD02_01115 [Halobacteriales archaeon QS_8_69_73]
MLAAVPTGLHSVPWPSRMSADPRNSRLRPAASVEDQSKSRSSSDSRSSPPSVARSRSRRVAGSGGRRGSSIPAAHVTYEPLAGPLERPSAARPAADGRRPRRRPCGPVRPTRARRRRPRRPSRRRLWGSAPRGFPRR